MGAWTIAIFLLCLTRSVYAEDILITRESQEDVHLQVTDISVKECGKSKGCLRTPRDCVPPDCDIVVTWKDRSADEQVDFEYGRSIKLHKDQTQPWIALGFSNDTDMGGTSVVDCIVNASDHNSIIVQASYNWDHDNQVIQPNNQLGLVANKSSASYVNHFFTCQFTKPVVVKNVSKAYLAPDLRKSYYFLLAEGRASETGHKYCHTKIPVNSANKIDVSKNNDLDFLNVKIELKFHACLMIAGWMILASVGIIAPRQFKLLWIRKLMGSQAWFQVHRIFMLVTFLVVLAAFILIFVTRGMEPLYVNNDKDRTHPLIGLTVGCLMVLNPILAVFRPKPDSYKRPIFNWLHSIIGNSAHILAVVAIYFGLLKLSDNEVGWLKWVVVAFGAWKILIEIVMTIHRIVSREASSSDTYRELSDTASGENVQFHSSKSVCFKNGVVALYLTGALAAAVLLMYNIVTNDWLNLY